MKGGSPRLPRYLPPMNPLVQNGPNSLPTRHGIVQLSPSSAQTTRRQGMTSWTAVDICSPAHGTLSKSRGVDSLCKRPLLELGYFRFGFRQLPYSTCEKHGPRTHSAASPTADGNAPPLPESLNPLAKASCRIQSMVYFARTHIELFTYFMVSQAPSCNFARKNP